MTRDIAELDEDAHRIKTCLTKAKNMEASAGATLRAVRTRMQDGEFGPDWTFTRWCIEKCAISRATVYRLMGEIDPTRKVERNNRAKASNVSAETFYSTPPGFKPEDLPQPTECQHLSNRPKVSFVVLTRNEWQTRALENEPTTPEEAKVRYNAIGWEAGEVERVLWGLREAEGNCLNNAKRFFSTVKDWRSWVQSLKTCPGTTHEANLALYAIGDIAGGSRTKRIWAKHHQMINKLNEHQYTKWCNDFEALTEKYAAEIQPAEEFAPSRTGYGAQ